MDIAELGLEIHSDSVPRATQRLRDFEGQAGRAERSTNALAGAMRILGPAIASVAAALSFQALGRMADRYTSLSNILRVVAGEQADVNRLISDLNAIAGRTRTPLDAIGTLYQRASIAANELGASQADLLRFTENVGLALAQQGGSAESASGALLQLSQALGSGVVRAEEFNSILEGAYPIAQAAARGIDAAGGSVARLRSLIIEGKITSDEFFRAILSQTEELEAAFANTTPTIGQAFTVLGNNLTLFVGRLNEASGASSGFASAMIGVADAILAATEPAAQIAAVIGENFERILYWAGAVATFMSVQWVAGFVAARVATFSLTAALTALRGALIRTGIGALIVLAGELVYQFVQLVERTGGVGQAFVKIGQIGAEVWERIQIGAYALDAALGAVADSIMGYFLHAWASIQEGFAGVINAVASPLNAIREAMGQEALTLDVSTNVQGTRNRADQHLGAAQSGFALAGSEFSRMMSPLQSLQGVSDEQQQVIDQFAEIAGGASAYGALQEGIGAPGDGSGVNGALEAANDNIATLRESLSEFIDIEDPFTTVRENLAGLQELLAAGEISWQQYGHASAMAMASAASATLSAVGKQTSMLASAFEDNKAFALANAVVSGLEAVVSSYAAGARIGGPILGAAFAATAAAATAAQIGAIMSAKPGSASMGGSGGGGTAAAPAPVAPPEPSRTINVTLGGNGRYSRDEVRDLLEQLTGELNDGAGTKFKMAVNG